MNNVAVFESRELKINREIEQQVEAITATPGFTLPKSDTALVQLYVDKIQGTYDVTRAKRDTDNAVDLLYIAYNTTPQKAGEVRVRIANIMNRLITAQQSSELVMRQSMDTSNRIRLSLNEMFPDWADIRADNNQAEIKAFVTKDMVRLALDIRDKALGIRDRLLAISATYDDIIRETIQTTDRSEKLLSQTITDGEALQRELDEANARRAQLESLVTDLKTQVAEFEKKARDYEQRANTAEKRAFIMSIVRMGAQVISSAIPAIAMVAGGPAPMLASSVGSALGGLTKDTPSPAKEDAGQSSSASAPAPGGGTGAKRDTATTETRLSEQRSELRKSEEKRDSIKADLKLLEDKKKALSSEADNAGGGPGKAMELTELGKRIQGRSDELKSEEDKIAQQNAIVSSLQASLGALDKGLTKLSDEQQQQAASLRDIQMQMINKAEEYEKERRTQAAELIKVTALLKGKRTEDENLKLAIRSLNVSITALKRMKEIVEEVAFFFKTFADFMQAVADEADHQITSIENVAGMEVIRKNRFTQLVRSIDEFFVRQTAQWYAVTNVCDKFHRSFAEGWSKLNKLSGTYITGDELEAYLAKASVQIGAIVAEREAASESRIASLSTYREELSKSA